MTGDYRDEVFADDALRTLWGDDEPRQRRDADVRYRLLPNATTPRLVLPDRPRAAAATILRSLRDASTTKARLKTQLVAASFVAPPTSDRHRYLPRPAILAELEALLGRGPLVAGIHLGPARANRKPVLALSSEAGQLVGFAKVAVNDLTTTLVCNEASFLRRAPLDVDIALPSLLAEGSWSGRPLTVQAPVRDVGRRVNDSTSVARAQVELAAAFGFVNAASDYLRQLDHRLAKVQEVDPDNAANARQLRDIVGDLADDAATSSVPCGAWHGDWRATNMAVGKDGIAVWDWERFAEGVPLGFDALHLALTTSAREGRALSLLTSAMFADAPALLAPFGIDDRTLAHLITTSYLVEFATRSIEDQQSRTGARLGDVRRWLLPELEARRTSTP